MDSIADWEHWHLAAGVGIDVILKATVLLGLAWGAAVLLRHASAAARHGVWALALVGLLLLPALTTGLPGWYVEAPEALRPLLGRGVMDDGVFRAPTVLEPVHERMGQAEALQPLAGGERSGEVHQEGGVLPAVRPVASGAAVPTGVAWAAWFVLLWGVGALVLLARLLIHVVRIRVLTRHAEVLADARRVETVTRLARQLGIRRRVRVLCSPEISMAMTWGVWRPVVMLPYQARFWSEERRQVVLLHELAHVKRYDYLVHLLAQLMRAWYWFNPLVWIAARRVYVEQERACDDQVLQAGAGACDYAMHLLDIARAFLRRPAPLPGGLAMVRGSTLRERIEAILNVGSNRHALTLKTAFSVACMGASLIVPVATVHLCQSATTVETGVLAGSALPTPERRGLYADDPAVWRRAARSPDVADTTLAALLRHKDAEMRGRAAWSLGERRAAHAVAALLTALSDTEPHVRVEAVRALGKMKDRRTLEALTRALHDSCPDVRVASVQALEEICRCHALEAVPVALADPSTRVRMTAANVLGETIRGLHADDDRWAKRALRDHLGPAVRALIGALDDDSPVVRQRVAYALGVAQDEAALDALEAAVQDGAAAVRLEAVRALGKIGVPCAIPALRSALHDPDPGVRSMAARVLSRLNVS